MDINNFLKQKTFKLAVLSIGALILLLLVFKAGVFVGYKKASFSYSWGENYHRNFAGPRGGFLSDFGRGFEDKDFIGAHGTSGSIIKIDGSTLMIKGGDNVEKTILISDQTTIASRRKTIKAGDLKVDDRVVIIGSPNEQGQIEAKFIRLF
ncbi:hypothetical protein A3G55_02830 [Candidatus Giovannonibacteria bacterium RIFCSPLOWO2_12_FULL_44_25]|uniref:DUF5666 domain-containing protein n=4 Tax=Parcubacteria group TaxID=1794811 RepID=A0A837IQK7_9BACT|nr:MAG: hypothetical protein UW15_C0014G0030 [Parcubacteria group bacterium GW2011_GWC1_44_10]KKT57086.1 MAG: hypothetical protein UW49_C0008G0048 [Candidatus Giovannonibacteria bacterium GW2011_GWB1_44_23]KKT59523.1 MAG: hypothetical protein UW53_C0011G0052 [Candidatus Giovannonibacteria bacterium GW2011_GWA1_44_25]KKU11898.1 MAG: hypothetical protein UX18_C0038G0006 [Candidatus Azambacteria bacterium GW2011_GWC2_45_7b]OGF49970.1 MAG: hypothetical protein A2120_04655 [Candidatus Giovannonibact